MQIILIIVVIAGLMIFSVTTRNHITTAFATAGYLVQGAWARRPTTSQVLRIILIPILMMFVPWIIFFIIMTWLGTMFNAPWAGALIGILFPMWSFMFLIRKIPLFSRIVAIPYWITTAVLLIVVPLFLIGFWSPDVKGSLNERSDDSKVWTANFFKKGSAHSERNAGVRGRVKSATGVYDDFRKQIKNRVIPAGKIIMILDFKSKPATEDSEALSLVMLSNEYGNFVGGEKVWMPALKIEFISNEEQEAKSEPPAKSSAENQGSFWKIRYEKPEGGYSEWEKATVEKDGSQTIIKTISNGRRIVFEGKEENGIFCGIWEQKDAPYKKGNFFFKTTLFEMDGYETDFQEGERKFPFQLKRF